MIFMQLNCSKILTFFVIFILLSGCNADDICLSNQNALHADFFSMETKERVAMLRTTIWGLGMPEDSTIYNDEPVSKMFLKLSFDKDTTSFIIMRQTIKDTIHFVHSKKLDFVSRKCGFTFNFKIDTVYFTGIFIDSVAVINPNIKYNENIDNLEIYTY
jgi:hypothetical protein